MRRPFLAFAFIVIALVTVACAAARGPAWTYAPPTQAPASQPAASGGSPTPSAAPSEGTGGAVQISASNINFEQKEVTAPAGAAFVIHFNNKDASTQHNVEIKDASGMSMFKGEIITGPKEIDYKVPALPAGTYQFICTVHPNMIGTLKVGG